MRLAGTARQYSKKAMPQLIRTTCQSTAWGNLSCPYQAKVMKMLEANSSRMGAKAAMAGPWLMGGGADERMPWAASINRRSRPCVLTFSQWFPCAARLRALYNSRADDMLF